MAIKFADIEAAHLAIRQALVVTLSVGPATLLSMTGTEIYLKLEKLQYTASFKERTVLNRLRALSEEKARRGVIAASAGNHAQGVAYHAKRLGIRQQS